MMVNLRVYSTLNSHRRNKTIAQLNNIVNNIKLT